MCSCNQKRVTVANTVTQRMASAVPLKTVDTSIWGPPLWLVLHTLSFSATDRNIWLGIFNALKTGLPCPDCSKHYNDWARSNPLQFPISPPPRQPFIPKFLKTPSPISLPPVSATVSRWIVLLHNSVSARRGVPLWSVEQCRTEYKDMNAARKALASLNGQIGPTLFSLLKQAIA
jgi:hypothetical protein